MTHPNPGWQQQPQPGPPQQYQGHPPLGGPHPGQAPMGHLPVGQPPMGPGGMGPSGMGPGGMNQPYPGGPSMPQQYPGQQYPGQPYGPPRQSGGAAVVAGLLFLPVVIYTYVAAILSWDGIPPSPHVDLSVLGMIFSYEITRNGDFAITMSMIVASLVLVLALVQVFRVPGVRWALVGLGALCTVYYVYAVIHILAHGGGEFVVVPVVCLLLWLAATVVAALPAVGRAARRGRPRPGLAPPPGRWG